MMLCNSHKFIRVGIYYHYINIVNQKKGTYQKDEKMFSQRFNNAKYESVT